MRHKGEKDSEYQLSKGVLIYLAAPFSAPDPEVSRRRLDEVNRYAAHLFSRGALVFSRLSHGAQFDLPDIPTVCGTNLDCGS